jgi:hypothetical protein
LSFSFTIYTKLSQNCPLSHYKHHSYDKPFLQSCRCG